MAQYGWSQSPYVAVRDIVAPKQQRPHLARQDQVLGCPDAPTPANPVLDKAW